MQEHNQPRRKFLLIYILLLITFILSITAIYFFRGFYDKKEQVNITTTNDGKEGEFSSSSDKNLPKQNSTNQSNAEKQLLSSSENKNNKQSHAQPKNNNQTGVSHKTRSENELNKKLSKQTEGTAENKQETSLINSDKKNQAENSPEENNNSSSNPIINNDHNNSTEDDLLEKEWSESEWLILDENTRPDFSYLLPNANFSLPEKVLIGKRKTGENTGKLEKVNYTGKNLTQIKNGQAGTYIIYVEVEQPLILHEKEEQIKRFPLKIVVP